MVLNATAHQVQERLKWVLIDRDITQRDNSREIRHCVKAVQRDLLVVGAPHIWRIGCQPDTTSAFSRPIHVYAVYTAQVCQIKPECGE